MAPTWAVSGLFNSEVARRPPPVVAEGRGWQLKIDITIDCNNW